MLAAPDQMALIHGKQKMDERRWGGLHESRGLDFTEANKMDGTSERLVNGGPARHI